MGLLLISWVYRVDPQRTGYYPKSCSSNIFSPSEVAGWLVRSEQDIFYTTPALYDYNDDGVPDLVLATSAPGFPLVDVYTWEGENLWHSDKSANTWGTYLGSPALYDADGDGVADVIAGPYADFSAGTLRVSLGCFSHTGATLWETTLFEVADSTSEVWGGTLLHADTLFFVFYFVYDYDIYDVNLWGAVDPKQGRLIWADTAFNLSTTVLSPPAAGDFDGDGESEVLFAVYDKLFVYSLDGHLEETVNLSPNLGGPALADVDGDGDLEAFLYAYGYIPKLYIVDGTSYRQIEVGYSDMELLHSPAVADVNLDGNVDAVLNLGDKLVLLLGPDYVPVNLSTAELQGAPILADLDSDPYPELVVGGAPEGGDGRCKIEGWDFDTSSQTFVKVWQIYHESNYYVDAVMGDIVIANFLTDDPEPELAALDYSCWVMVVDLSGEEVSEGTAEGKPRAWFDGAVLRVWSPKAGELKLFDSSGRLVRSASLKPGLNEFGFLLKRGIYFVDFGRGGSKLVVR